MMNNDTKDIIELKREIIQVKECAERALEALEKGDVEQARDLIKHGLSAIPIKSLVALRRAEPAEIPQGSRVIEGAFDGQHMIGQDGKNYLVPPNYASKSKIVEGDLMKLSITPQGAFIYKQIGPVARKRVTSVLEQRGEGMWQATDGAHYWRLINAAVSYFKGKAGDEVVIIIPANASSKWAAVDNIISK